MRVALVYDRVNKWGGAERVLLALHNLFPDAPLYTSVYNRNLAQWAKSLKVIPSFLQNIIPGKTFHEAFAPLMPLAFESFSFDEYDLVISVSSEAAKGILTKPPTMHINICLTPTRYLWSGYDEYFSNKILKFFTSPLIYYLKTWDKVASARPDHYIAISKNVQDRIRKYYNRTSSIIYPPLSINIPEIKIESVEPYFLLVSRLSRLVPYKKVDIALEACNKLGVPLKVIGGGRDIEYFKRKAGPTVEFLGWLTDEKLSYYYSSCQALIFPGDEDFGLVMVEAQAHGAPVIAYRGGGAMEIIKEGITGEFFDKQNPASLIGTLKRFEQKRYNRSKCRENAKRFERHVFEADMREFVKKTYTEYTKENI